MREIPRALLPILAACILFSGCQPKLQSDVHAERAHDLMMRARAEAGSGGIDYRDDLWLEVIEELSQINEQYVNYEADMALMTEIKAMRAAAFLADARARDKEKAEQKQREAELNQRIDRILDNPFSPGGSGSDLSEGGRWDVILEKEHVTTQSGLYQVTGEIVNVSQFTIERPIVVVDFLGRGGGVAGTAQGTIEPSRIPPMGTGIFRVKARAAGIRTHKIVIRELSGSPLRLKVPDQP